MLSPPPKNFPFCNRLELRQTLTNFRNSFTAGKSVKFATPESISCHRSWVDSADGMYWCRCEYQVDIDNILLMAETRNTDDMNNSATDELLSQFKVSLPITSIGLFGCAVTERERSWRLTVIFAIVYAFVRISVDASVHQPYVLVVVS